MLGNRKLGNDNNVRQDTKAEGRRGDGTDGRHVTQADRRNPTWEGRASRKNLKMLPTNL